MNRFKNEFSAVSCDWTSDLTVAKPETAILPGRVQILDFCVEKSVRDSKSDSVARKAWEAVPRAIPHF